MGREHARDTGLRLLTALVAELRVLRTTPNPAIIAAR